MRALVTFLVLVAAVPALRAQIKVPKPPDTYDAQIRYRITADPNERVLQFEAMTRFLAGLRFRETVTDESDLAPFDPNAELMRGTVPSRTARDLLRDRRVQTIVLAPAGFKPPEDPKAPVRILVELASSRDQLALFNQTEIALRALGFKTDLGFDTRKFTVLRGTIPWSTVPKLLKDLRFQPSGWFIQETPAELYAALRDGSQTPELVKPFGDAVPVRVVEILGSAESAPPVVRLPPIPEDQPHLVKFTADLRRRLAEEGAADKPLRLEVVLVASPPEADVAWRQPFRQAGATIEGRVGPVVTVTVPKGSQAASVAALPDVASVRLPRMSSAATGDQPAGKKVGAREDKEVSRASAQDLPAPLLSAPEPAPADVLKETGLDRLHAMGGRGKGVRVVVIDTDFAGWQERLAAAARDPRTAPRVTFLDLTAERNKDARPEPMPGALGHGTHAALAVRLAAPDAELNLVRVPPDAPYHLVNIARAIRGDLFRTEGLVARRQEIELEMDSLRQRRDAAMREYRAAFESFEDDAAARQRRLAAQKALAGLDVEDKVLLERLNRVEALEQGISRLWGAHVVLNQLHWNTGFALDGTSTVSRFLDEWLTLPRTTYTRHLSRPNPDHPPLWFQPAGDTRGQTWTGPWRDADRNGVMEFAPMDETLKPGRWSHELNFLARRDAGGRDVLDFPAGSKVRISVQWREPHDPEVPELDYRVPVAPIRLQLVQQRDPNGEKFASDEIDLVAESEGLPARLHIEPRFGVYEHSLELTLPADGRYAVRLEGRVPNRVRPPTVPTLPAQEVHWELRPRLFVESADGKARFALADFASAEGGVAVPADARSVFAVGAADASGKPRAFSAGGAGPGTLLLTKPDLYAPDELPKLADESPARGSALAASFAAGWAASLQSAGLRPGIFRQSITPGTSIKVPEEWFRK
ncbi:MAG TPA: hypothetical protein VKD90_14720 [Gemmataceae bacterium]|nr:hypothetical protein [Gemmataceae bacterium]